MVEVTVTVKYNDAARMLDFRHALAAPTAIGDERNTEPNDGQKKGLLSREDIYAQQTFFRL